MFISNIFDRSLNIFHKHFRLNVQKHNAANPGKENSVGPSQRKVILMKLKSMKYFLNNKNISIRKTSD